MGMAIGYVLLIGDRTRNASNPSVDIMLDKKLSNSGLPGWESVANECRSLPLGTVYTHSIKFKQKRK